MTLRKHYDLTHEEQSKLAIVGDDVWLFWNAVARRCGVDSASIIADIGRPSFTALPIGHRKHWCHPLPLACKARPDLVDTK